MMAAELRRLLPVLGVLAVPALLPFGRSAELPLLLGAVAGLVLAARDPSLRRVPEFRLATLLFLGYWLPELLSAPDALDRGRAWREVAVDLRFLPFLWFVIAALRAPGALSLAWRGLAVIVAAFAADALLQAGTGASLGGPASSDRLSGVFGADDLKLGPVLAVLAPVPLLVGWQRGGWRGFALALALLLPVVLLAGARAGWIGLAVAVVAVPWHRAGARRALAVAGMALAAALLLGLVSYHASERFAARVERTAALRSADAAGLDHALAGRLAIFDAGWRMGLQHPVNGVGVRAFRVAYPDYARPDDRWVREGGTALHAHHWALEVFSETGLLGLAGWLGALLLGWRAWRGAGRPGRQAAAPAAIALLVLLFPINTHLAVYSSVWGMLLFVLVGLFVAALAHVRLHPPLPRTAAGRAA